MLMRCTCLRRARATAGFRHASATCRACMPHQRSRQLLLSAACVVGTALDVCHSSTTPTRTANCSPVPPTRFRGEGCDSLPPTLLALSRTKLRLFLASFGVGSAHLYHSGRGSWSHSSIVCPTKPVGAAPECAACIALPLPCSFATSGGVQSVNRWSLQMYKLLVKFHKPHCCVWAI